jgi:phosphotransferase system HPr (HPr) family protein
MPASSEPQPVTEPVRITDIAERTVVLPKHLHARPAGQIAQAAARHQGTTIELVVGDRRANARSVLAVMALGAVTGSQIRVITTGSGAEAAADEVVGILLGPELEE